VKEQQKLGELAQVMGKVNVYRERQQAFDSEYNSMLQAQRSEFVSKPVPIADLRNMYEYLGALATAQRYPRPARLPSLNPNSLQSAMHTMLRAKSGA
jgi:hypothetical protein